VCGSALPACGELPFGGGSADAAAVEVYAWGENDRGQLGDGTFEQRLTPVKVVGLPGDVRQLSAGPAHSLALMADGSVWAWGSNGMGQLGNGNTTNSNRPVKVFGLTSVTAVAAGSQHSLAVTSDGSVYGWGENARGQLGTGTTTDAPTTAPVRMVGVDNAAQVAAGFGASYVLDKVGNLFAVGSNDQAQLGIGTAKDVRVVSPTAVVGVAPVTHVDAGNGHAVALRYDNIAWAWGNDFYGQLGDQKASKDPDPDPSPVRGFIVDGRNLAIGIAAGQNHTVVIAGATDGSANTRVWSVGQGKYGQLGNGATDDQSFRVAASNLTQVTHVDAGFRHTVARDSSGHVWAWGQNLKGAIGDGTTTPRTTPVQIPSLSGVTAVAAGANSSFAIRTAAG
jgi:alpha-tubulin suppressor-like RCC1 family protein